MNNRAYVKRDGVDRSVWRNTAPTAPTEKLLQEKLNATTPTLKLIYTLNIMQ